MSGGEKEAQGRPLTPTRLRAWSGYRELREEDLSDAQLLTSPPSLSVGVTYNNTNANTNVPSLSMKPNAEQEMGSVVGSDDGAKKLVKPPFFAARSNRNSSLKGNNNSNTTIVQKFYYCPSNTIVANNGGVYHVEPYMLPPPQQMSEMIRDLMNAQNNNNNNNNIDNNSYNNQGEKNAGASADLGSPEKRKNKHRSHSYDSSFASFPSIKLSREHVKHRNNTGHNSSVFKNGDNNKHNSNNDNNKENNENDNSTDNNSNNNDNNDNNNDNNENDKADSVTALQKTFARRDSLRTHFSVGSRSESVFTPTSSSKKLVPPVMTQLQSTAMFAPEETPRGGDVFFEGIPLASYLQTELFGMGKTLQIDSNAVHKIQNFLSVPVMLEKFVCFGLFICFDAYLYVLTILPIRVCAAMVALLCDQFSFISFSTTSTTNNTNTNSSGGKEGKWLFNRAHRFDLLRGVFFVIGCCTLSLFNMSRVYHFIRGQNMIKLYVLTAMLEVLGNLLGSLGQDVFESLHAQTIGSAWQWSNIVTYFVVSVYIMLHAGIYFVYTATLLVAINSADQALITVLILNNFAEIKGFVFKKFDRASLFQLTCADVTERFQIILFMFLILLVSVAQAASSPEEWKRVLYDQCLVFVLMLSCEAVADWMKHAFIAKFNSLQAESYDDMTRVLRKDIVNVINNKTVLDHNYTIIRRVGLSQIPLGCVTIRFIMLVLESPPIKEYLHSLTTTILWLSAVGCFLLLLTMKLLTGVGLIYFAGWMHNQELRNRLQVDPVTHMSDKAKWKERREVTKQLSIVERFTPYKGRLQG